MNSFGPGLLCGFRDARDFEREGNLLNPGNQPSEEVKVLVGFLDEGGNEEGP